MIERLCGPERSILPTLGVRVPMIERLCGPGRSIPRTLVVRVPMIERLHASCTDSGEPGHGAAPACAPPRVMLTVTRPQEVPCSPPLS